MKQDHSTSVQRTASKRQISVRRPGGHHARRVTRDRRRVRNDPFVAPPDSLYQDNSDSNGDYGVNINAVPERSTGLLVGLGCAGFAINRNRNKGDR